MKCFEALGLASTATPDEVKAAWRRLAMLKHPDRGGDPVAFDKLRKAYDEAMVEASAAKPCVRCAGTGQVRHGSGWSSVNLVCPGCEGSGEQS